MARINNVYTRLYMDGYDAVSYTHLRAHETPEHLVCRLLLEKKKKDKLNHLQLITLKSS